jgi:hypothetical protein
MKKMTKPNFEIMQQEDVPQSRNGKHRHIVTAILSDVMDLKEGAAIKIPLEALKDTKENVRSALSRESKKRKMQIATATDSGFLYVWRTKLAAVPDRGKAQVQRQSATAGNQEFR